MVTSRQFTRGVVRTVRAMDRAAKQAERQRIARVNAAHRQAQLESAARTVDQYDAILEAMTGAHRVAFSRRDWLKDATAPAVSHPTRLDVAEQAARQRLEEYVPGWFTRMLRREEKVRLALSDGVDEARLQDDASHLQRMAQVEKRNREIQAAQRLLARDPATIAEALQRYSALEELPFAVEGVDTLFIDRRVIAVVDALDLEDMPDESYSLLKSGKASVKALPIGKRHELHRDNVCSAAVRVAVEFLAALPIDEVEVLMLTDVLDRGSGHIAPAPVLHLRVTAQAISAIALSRADAAAIVERLGGHMNWTKRDDFRPINSAAFGIDLESEGY